MKIVHSCHLCQSAVLQSSGAICETSMLPLSAAGQTRLVINWLTAPCQAKTSRHVNCSQPELINFEILFSPIVCDIMIRPSIILIDYSAAIVPIQPLANEVNHLHAFSRPAICQPGASTSRAVYGQLRRTICRIISWCQSAASSKTVKKRCWSRAWLIVSSALASVQTFTFTYV